MKFRAIIFDLDGTLIDSLEDLADAMNNVLKKNRFPAHPADAYKYFIGDGMEKLVERALPVEQRDPETIARCIAAMKREYPGQGGHKTRPYEGIPEVIEAFHRAGLKMAILTNKPDGPTREVVSKLLPKQYFEAVRGAGPEFPLKPDPAGALHLVERFAVAPAQCLFLGDSAVDMQTASKTGIYAAGVLWGFRTADELISAGARMLVKSPADLLPWIEPENP